MTTQPGTEAKLGYRWEPFEVEGLSARENAGILDRIESILLSWDGTPYMAGQQTKGRAVDCARFVAAVLDELYGEPRSRPEALPQDAAMHDPRLAAETIELMRRIYRPNLEVANCLIQPADIVVVGPPGGGPGHAMIAGFRPNTLWHSIAAGRWVRQAGFGAPWSYKVFGLYRQGDREKWL